VVANGRRHAEQLADLPILHAVTGIEILRETYSDSMVGIGDLHPEVSTRIKI